MPAGRNVEQSAVNERQHRSLGQDDAIVELQLRELQALSNLVLLRWTREELQDGTVEEVDNVPVSERRQPDVAVSIRRDCAE